VFAVCIWYFGVVNVREERIRIRTYECGVGGSVKIVSLVQYLQEVAALHAEQLGFGLEKMNELDGYWVLSNLRVEIARLPKWNEEITIRTWPSGYTRLVASREFVAKDRDNRDLFLAGSEWMVLDKQRSRPKNLFHLDLSLPKIGTKALQEKLSRLEPHDGGVPVRRLRVPHSSIDLNGHVNNTEYIRWGIDALGGELKARGDIRCVQATYLSEVFEDDELDMLASSDPGGHFRVLARKSDTQTNVFLMEVTC
jgi:acyl-ACP thioesterase